MTVIDLKNKKTVSKKTPEIDSLYAYDTKHRVKFTHRHQLGSGYKYTNHKAIINAGEDKIHIYHRTATINGVTKGLTMVTKNGKFREVQRWFNERIKDIEMDAEREHTSLEGDNTLFYKFSHAKATPVELGLLYTY